MQVMISCLRSRYLGHTGDVLEYRGRRRSSDYVADAAVPAADKGILYMWEVAQSEVAGRHWSRANAEPFPPSATPMVSDSTGRDAWMAYAYVQNSVPNLPIGGSSEYPRGPCRPFPSLVPMGHGCWGRDYFAYLNEEAGFNFRGARAWHMCSFWGLGVELPNDLFSLAIL